MFLFFWSDVVCAYCLFAEQVWSLFWHRPCFIVYFSFPFFFFSFFFFFFFWGTCLLLLLLFFFFFLTNPFVQDLKLSDLLSIFVLLGVLSFLIDLIITSYRCISQNSSEKLKQKETIRTSKTGHGSRNWAVGQLFLHGTILHPKQTVKFNGSRFSRSDHTVRSGFQNLANKCSRHNWQLWTDGVINRVIELLY